MEETDRISKARPTRLFACDYGCPRRCRQEECRATTATRGLSGKRAPQTNESPNQLPVHLDARFTSRCPQALDSLYKAPRRSMRIVCMSFASLISPVGTKPFLRQKATRFGDAGRTESSDRSMGATIPIGALTSVSIAVFCRWRGVRRTASARRRRRAPDPRKGNEARCGGAENRCAAEHQRAKGEAARKKRAEAGPDEEDEPVDRHSAGSMGRTYLAEKRDHGGNG